MGLARERLPSSAAPRESAPQNPRDNAQRRCRESRPRRDLTHRRFVIPGSVGSRNETHAARERNLDELIHAHVPTDPCAQTRDGSVEGRARSSAHRERLLGRTRHADPARTSRRRTHPSTAEGSIGRAIVVDPCRSALIEGRVERSRPRWIPWYADRPSPLARLSSRTPQQAMCGSIAPNSEPGLCEPDPSSRGSRSPPAWVFWRANETEQATPRATRAVRLARAPDARQTRGTRSRQRHDAVVRRTRARVATRDPAGV